MSSEVNFIRSMTDLKTVIKINILAGTTCTILGDPGIGKTEGVEQIINVMADEGIHPMGWEPPENWAPKMVGFYASQHEGTDLSGYPVLSADGEALTFKVMQKLRSLNEGDALVIDEVTLADENTLKPCLQLTSGDRPSVNDWVGPQHVARIMMGNLATSGNYDYVLNPVQCNRGKVYEYLGPTVDEWLTYGMAKGLHPAILTAIKMEGASLLLNWNPSRDRNPTHRSWVTASKSLLAAEHLYPGGVPMDVRLSELASAVGDSAALQVETLLTLQDKLVPYATVVAHPTTAPVPDGHSDPEAQFLMATHVANKCRPDDWSSVARYIERFPLELQATMTSPIVARHPVLLTTSEYANYASRTGNLR